MLYVCCCLFALLGYNVICCLVNILIAHLEDGRASLNNPLYQVDINDSDVSCLDLCEAVVHCCTLAILVCLWLFECFYDTMAAMWLSRSATPPRKHMDSYRFA